MSPAQIAFVLESISDHKVRKGTAADLMGLAAAANRR